MTPEILIPYYYYYSNSHGKFVTWFPYSKHQVVAYIALGPVHTEIFLRFCIVSSNGLVVLDSLGNSKQNKNAGKRFRVYGALGV